MPSEYLLMFLRARLSDSQPVYEKSEEEVLEILELPYIDPTTRNADA